MFCGRSFVGRKSLGVIPKSSDYQIISPMQCNNTFRVCVSCCCIWNWILGFITIQDTQRPSWTEILWYFVISKHPFQLFNHFEIWHRAWQWYCHALCKISKWLDNCEKHYGQITFLRDLGWILISYVTTPLYVPCFDQCSVSLQIFQLQMGFQENYIMR